MTLTRDQFKQRRLALGLSQTALALRLGITGNTVSRWERGHLAIPHPPMVDLALTALAYELVLPTAHRRLVRAVMAGQPLPPVSAPDTP